MSFIPAVRDDHRELAAKKEAAGMTWLHELSNVPIFSPKKADDINALLAATGHNL